MKQELDEVIEVIPEPFDTLEECMSYYINILGNLKEALDKELINKKEYKKKKAFTMTQWGDNLKLLKKKDNTRINHEEKKLKDFKHLPTKDKKIDKLEPPANKPEVINPTTEQYLIEDTKEKKDEN